MQNIVRYTKILMNIGTKILLVLLWLFYIYGIYNILFYNWHSEFVGHPKGMHLPHNIYWLVWGINFIILKSQSGRYGRSCPNFIIWFCMFYCSLFPFFCFRQEQYFLIWLFIFILNRKNCHEKNFIKSFILFNFLLVLSIFYLLRFFSIALECQQCLETTYNACSAYCK